MADAGARLPENAVGTPLVLRLYQGRLADEKAAREAAAIRMLAATAYPVPRPYLFEPDHQALGAPFLVMERVAGGPLFSTGSFARAFKTFSLGFIDFVRQQAALHRLRLPAAGASAGLTSARGGASAGGGLLTRILDLIERRIAQGPLPGLREAFARLREQAGRFQTAPDAIVHLDYHPQNVIVRNFRVTGVIDWVAADYGDRHLCAATTSVILATSAMEHPRWMRDNAAGNFLRRVFRTLYLPLYHALAPVDLPRIRYCQGVAALARLAMFGLMQTQGAEAAGFRRDAIAHVTPDVVRLLSRYASRRIGVPTCLAEERK